MARDGDVRPHTATASYEHNGVLYQEPLPRILLVNFSRSAVEGLHGRGHNTKSCLVRKEPGETTKSLTAPAPPHEVDIVLVRDEAEQEVKDIASVGSTAPQRLRKFITFSGDIEWPSGYADTFSAYCHAVLQRGGLLVFLVSEVPGLLLQRAELKVSLNAKHKIWPDKSALRLPTPPGQDDLAVFVRRWIKQSPACLGLDIAAQETAIPLVEDTTETPYAALIRPTDHPKGAILCLPASGEHIDLLHLLVADVIPVLMPGLYPMRANDAWRNDPDMAHPRIVELRGQQDALRASVDQQLARLDSDIEEVERTDAFMRDLVGGQGASLTAAVQAAVKALAMAANVGAIGVRETEGGLALQWGTRTFLLTLASHEQALSQIILNDVSRRHRAYLQDHPRERDRVHSLLIANAHSGAGIDPRRRPGMFGLATDEAAERLSAEGHGAIETCGLFRLLRAVQRRQVSLTSDILMRLLYSVGMVDMSEFLASLRPSPTVITAA